MTEVEKLRAGLAEQLKAAQASAEEADRRVTAAETDLRTARWAVMAIEARLEAHDAAVAAMGGQEPAAAPARRRNLVEEVRERLVHTSSPWTVDDFVTAIGNVRVAQVEGALKKLASRNEAFLLNGKWVEKSPVADLLEKTDA
jgi:hypothetical protein